MLLPQSSLSPILQCFRSFAPAHESMCSLTLDYLLPHKVDDHINNPVLCPMGRFSPTDIYQSHPTVGLKVASVHFKLILTHQADPIVNGAWSLSSSVMTSSVMNCDQFIRYTPSGHVCELKERPQYSVVDGMQWV